MLCMTVLPLDTSLSYLSPSILLLLTMRRFVFLLLLFAAASGASRPAAQKIIEKSATLAAGQRVYLNLKHASSIRIRAGAGGR